MPISVDTGFAVLAFFVVLGPLILAHEFGHLLAARWNKIKVEEFGVGYPPRMITLFERDGTKYTLNWLPLGGFMKPAGENDPTVEGGLAAASKVARISVLAAGAGANVLVAFLLLVLMFMLGAPETQPGALVALVEPDSPAASAGLQAGDTILYADDIHVDQYQTLIDYINTHTGETIALTIWRNGEELAFSLIPRESPPEGQGPTGIQVQPVLELRRHGFVAAIGRSFTEMGELASAFVTFPIQVIRQQIPARLVRPITVVGISQLGGRVIDESITQSAAWPILQLTAFISLALALTNLLPIPALDGGRILFVIIEAIRGRRVDPNRETLVHFVGFAVLVTMMLVFAYLDIVDPIF